MHPASSHPVWAIAQCGVAPHPARQVRRLCNLCAGPIGCDRRTTIVTSRANLAGTATGAHSRSAVGPGCGAQRDQWSAGRMWYSKSSPPTQNSRMIVEIASAQKYKNASEIPVRAIAPASMIGQ